MSNPINRKTIAQVATRVSKEINTTGEMKFPNTIFLEIGEKMPVLQLIAKIPNQVIDVVNYATWIEQWEALGIEKELVGKEYQEQVTLLCEHLPFLERHLGLMVMANAAQLHPTIPVIKRTYWLDYCFAPDGMEHTSEIFVEVKRPTRIYGECELTPSLIDAIDKGIIDPNSEYDMRRFQLIDDTQKSPEYKLEQMELNVAAHKQYMSEMHKLMFYAKGLTLEKRLDQLYFLIVHANNFSNDQMVHFHIDLGEGLIGEFEAPVDRGSWQTMLRLFERARLDVTTGVEAGQDVTQLAGASVNAHSLGEEPMDVSERVDIFLEYQHDAFFVIPLELWNGK